MGGQGEKGWEGESLLNFHLIFQKTWGGSRVIQASNQIKNQLKYFLGFKFLTEMHYLTLMAGIILTVLTSKKIEV